MIDIRSGKKVFVFIVYSRFIINIPAEQREDLVRVLFAVELAHWFFIDFYCEDYNDLHVCSIKEFAQQSNLFIENQLG